jgi:cell wall-associated NlpC family hydrolase
MAAQILNKLFLVLALTLFTLHPCFSATTQHHAKKQTTQSTTQLKKKVRHPVVSKTKKKTATRVHKKSVVKKSRKKRSKQKENKTMTHTTKTIKPAASDTAQVNTTDMTKTHLPGYLLTSIEKTLVAVVQKTIATVSYTAYKLGGTRIDTSRGIYIVDCSTYVDHVLKTVYPRAYTSLTRWSGSEKPTSNDYYHYFTNLSSTQLHWSTIDDVLELRPGDILVFRYKTKFGNNRGGHVMIVMDKPIQKADTFLVRVADSAPTGHSTDTRLPHASGIGIGTLLLKVDPKTYEPYAYAWKVGSRWDKNVTFAMARPIDVG